MDEFTLRMFFCDPPQHTNFYTRHRLHVFLFCFVSFAGIAKPTVQSSEILSACDKTQKIRQFETNFRGTVSDKVQGLGLNVKIIELAATSGSALWAEYSQFWSCAASILIGPSAADAIGEALRITTIQVNKAFDIAASAEKDPNQKKQQLDELIASASTVASTIDLKALVPNPIDLSSVSAFPANPVTAEITSASLQASFSTKSVKLASICVGYVSFISPPINGATILMLRSIRSDYTQLSAGLISPAVLIQRETTMAVQSSKDIVDAFTPQQPAVACNTSTSPSTTTAAGSTTGGSSATPAGISNSSADSKAKIETEKK